MRLPTLRRRDWSLTDVQEELRATTRQFFTRECPIDRVRGGDALDRELWDRVRELDLCGIGLPEEHGGAGGDLVDLVLVAEEAGRALAPVPFVEHAVVLRALARAGTPGAAHLAPVRHDAPHGTFAAMPQRHAEPVLVPYVASSALVVGLHGDELVAVAPHEPPVVDSLGGTPLSWCDLGGPDREVLVTGSDAVDAYAQALAEWKVLTAASLVGSAAGALDLTVAYANERVAFGVPIGTFQALSHPLADVLSAIEGARRLVGQAAWYLEHEPALAGIPVATAWLHATETANRAASVGIHTQGGFGFTLESDLHLFFRRAKSTVLVAGDPRADLDALADLAFGPAGHGATAATDSHA